METKLYCLQTVCLIIKITGRPGLKILPHSTSNIPLQILYTIVMSMPVEEMNTEKYWIVREVGYQTLGFQTNKVYGEFRATNIKILNLSVGDNGAKSNREEL